MRAPSLRIALLGYGRMNQVVESIAHERGHEVVARWTRSTPQNRQALRSADVAIDFSRPDAAAELCGFVLQCGVPVVSGTTGYEVDQLVAARQEALSKTAFLHANNLSLGVNAFTAANRLLARLLGRAGGFTADLNETHHVHKLDAPSGTAITLAKAVIEEHPDYEAWFLADDETHVQAERHLAIRSVREGEVFGIHELQFRGTHDLMTLRHEALSRRGFAEGAVVAAEYLHDKRGRHRIEQVLGLDASTLRA